MIKSLLHPVQGIHDDEILLNNIAKFLKGKRILETSLGLRNLLVRAAICDIDGIAILLGIDKRRAEHICRLSIQGRARISSILGTKDSRYLRKEILTYISGYASSKYGRNIILSIMPTLSKEELAERQSYLQESFDMYRKIKRSGVFERIKEKLRDFLLDSRSYIQDFEIQPIDYISERMRSIKVAIEIEEILAGSIPDEHFLTEEELGAAKRVKELFGQTEKGLAFDPESVLYDEELIISEEIKRKGLGGIEAKAVIENHILSISDSLNLKDDELEVLRKAAYSASSLPFSFDRKELKTLLAMIKERLSKEREERAKKLNELLSPLIEKTDSIIFALAKLDVSLAISEISEELSLNLPSIAGKEDGIAFQNGKNFFLLLDKDDEKMVQPVSYSIGRTNINLGAKARNVVMLTGANSGGKTTLLETTACIAIMTLLGLPVPAERSEVSPMPVYLFRRKMTRKIGSLEHALRSINLIFSSRQRKLILLDEFEALTEPGAAGRILACIINHIAPTSSLMLLVTHLARETLPYIRFSVRVDGINATGLSQKGELQVDRQPVFNQIGSSTPQLVIMKLLRSGSLRGRGREVYQDMLNLLEEKGEQPVQTPIYMPWLDAERT